jgi:hypothetical protein
MQSSEFFKGIDQQVHKDQRSDEAKRKHAEENRVLARKVIVEIKPLLERYKTELEQRGVRIELAIAGLEGDYLVFKMHYAHGGYFGFQLSDGSFGPVFTDKGTHYAGHGGGPSIRDGWDIRKFEDYVQRTINDFFLYAAREGGYLSKRD